MPLKENTLANRRDFLKDAFTMALGLSFTNISLLYSTGSQFVIYSSSTRTNRVCPCHLIINLKFTFYEHLEYNLRIYPARPLHQLSIKKLNYSCSLCITIESASFSLSFIKTSG